MNNKIFNKPFTQQEPLPQASIDRAVEVLQGGRLHRYNTLAGETAEAALLELEFARYLGVPYCLACSSGGYALHIALRSAGLKPDEPVLTNAWTLAPVPGAIHAAGGRPVLVEITRDYTIDLDDLAAKAAASGARFLMLSHMRGHMADMDAVSALCQRHGLTLIEDCAHTMGARWNGRHSGTFGRIGCFSTQTYKHLNSGEGGFLTSDDPEIMARAIIHSGSYMLYDRHLAAPEPAVFKNIRLETPNCSGRMDNLRAAILRVQLKDLDTNAERWNRRYRILERGLYDTPGLYLPSRPVAEQYVASSIQFSLPDFDAEHVRAFIDQCANRGVDIKWFGEDKPKAFTSRFDSWRYFDQPDELPRTRAVLATLCDMRIPLTFSEDDCRLIAEIIGDVVSVIANRRAVAS